MSREPALFMLLIGLAFLIASGLQQERSLGSRLTGWAGSLALGIAFWFALVFAIQHSSVLNRPIHTVCYEDGSCARDGRP